MIRFLINKPVSVLVFSVGMLILGIISFSYIPISLMPDIDIPVVTVRISEKNLSAREIENSLIKPIRTSLMQLNSIKDIKSQSRNETGTVEIFFRHGTDIDYSIIEVNEKIDRLYSTLPRSFSRPQIIKTSSSNLPVYYLNITRKQNIKNSFYQKGLLEFSSFTEDVIKRRIEQLDEVAMVDISGTTSPEIAIIPDTNMLFSLGLSIYDLESIIKENDLNFGNINVINNQLQYNVRIQSQLVDLESIENIYIKTQDKIVQLKDIALVMLRPQRRVGLVLDNKDESITLAIIKRSDVKMEELSKVLNSLIEDIKGDYNDLNFRIIRDQTKLLNYSIDNLTKSLLLGIFLAFIVMLCFLKNIRLSILICIIVPYSLIVSILFFSLFSLTINIISLSGLVLGIGLMIDNSIIVIDNIEQFRLKGFSIVESCIKGTNEVFKPLTSSLLTTTAVFIPLIFLSGISGALFYDQAMAITISLTVSLIVSVTLTPLLFKLINNNEKTISKKINYELRFFNYEKFYKKAFLFVMKNQKFSWLFFGLILLSTVILYYDLKKENLPKIENNDSFLQIDWNEQINTEENKSRTVDLIKLIEKEVISTSSYIGQQEFLFEKNYDLGITSTLIYQESESYQQRKEIESKLESEIKFKYPKASYTFKESENVFNLIFQNKNNLIAELRILNFGSDDYLNIRLDELLTEIDLDIPDLNIKQNVWQENTKLIVDLEKLIIYNVPYKQFVSKLESTIGKKWVVSVSNNNKFVPIVIGKNPTSLDKILSETFIVTKDSTSYSLNNFISKDVSKSRKTISGNLRGEYYPLDLSSSNLNHFELISKIKYIVESKGSFGVNFSGGYFEDKELRSELVFILLVSLLLLYLILAAQFESFYLPIIILIEVPLAVFGAFLLLKLHGLSLNLMSMIGIVVMSGIIINDSILKIDTIRQLEKKGMPILKALMVAGRRRLKPILMTSITTIFALIPLLFSDGIGAELQKPLAVSIIGGMLLGTIISLYVIPLLYFQFSTRNIFIKKLFK